MVKLGSKNKNKASPKKQGSSGSSNSIMSSNSPQKNVEDMDDMTPMSGDGEYDWDK